MLKLEKLAAFAHFIAEFLLGTISQFGRVDLCSHFSFLRLQGGIQLALDCFSSAQKLLSDFTLQGSHAYQNS